MKRILLFIAVVVALLAFVQPVAQAQPQAGGSVRSIICSVFKERCGEALRVAWCESRYDVNARNGKYLGLFQMGSSERATYGHGSDALTQARAAYRYFVATKKTWRPWSCKPW